MKTREIERLCLKKAQGPDKYKFVKEQIAKFMQSIGQDGGSKDPLDYFVIYLLDWQNEYDKVKRMLTELDLLSQVVTKQTARRMNLSVASNIVKQINSKMGGESIRLKMPISLQKELVMAIGIDVCHSGANSIVGFAASMD